MPLAPVLLKAVIMSIARGFGLGIGLGLALILLAPVKEWLRRHDYPIPPQLERIIHETLTSPEPLPEPEPSGPLVS
jgi:hypothetical protein